MNEYLHQCSGNLLLACIFLLNLIGCEASTTPVTQDKFFIKGEFKNLEFIDEEIFSIDVQSGKLFAGTLDGFKVFDIAGGEHPAHHKPGSRIGVFLILDESFWLISTAYPDGSKENAIFKSEDQGGSWLHYTNGFAEEWDGERRFVPGAMDYHTDYERPVIFASSTPADFIARSMDGGNTWENVAGSWSNPGLASTLFVKIDKNNSDIIWVGGADPFFDTRLSKSVNGGDDWEIMNILPYGSNIMFDVAVHHERSDHVLAGMGRGIMRTTNAGDSWETAYPDKNIHVLTKSSRNPEVIYASGVNANGTLFFLSSNDFGDMWVLQEFDNGPVELYVNDMVSVIENDEEVLYFGTSKGAFSFRIDG